MVTLAARGSSGGGVNSAEQRDKRVAVKLHLVSCEITTAKQSNSGARPVLLPEPLAPGKEGDNARAAPGPRPASLETRHREAGGDQTNYKLNKSVKLGILQARFSQALFSLQATAQHGLRALTQLPFDHQPSNTRLYTAPTSKAAGLTMGSRKLPSSRQKSH